MKESKIFQFSRHKREKGVQLRGRSRSKRKNRVLVGQRAVGRLATVSSDEKAKDLKSWHVVATIIWWCVLFVVILNYANSGKVVCSGERSPALPAMWIISTVTI